MTPDQMEQLARDLAAASEGGGRLDERVCLARGIDRADWAPTRFWPDTRRVLFAVPERRAAGQPAALGSPGSAFLGPPKDPPIDLELGSLIWLRGERRFDACVVAPAVALYGAAPYAGTSGGASPELAACAAAAWCLRRVALARAEVAAG